MSPREYPGTFTEEIYKPNQQQQNGNGQAHRLEAIPFLSQAEFVKGFVPPTYLVDGVLQRRFIYALTGRTGHAKTAIALALAQAIGCEDQNANFGGHAVDKGQVCYFVGENADDVRARVIAINALRADDSSRDRIYYIPGAYAIPDLQARVELEAQRLGDFALIIIDTSAAYFPGDDEINNTQQGAYARMQRALTSIRGGPCVLALCHPAKYVMEPSLLVPRGGGAYLNEIDGNFTCWRAANLVEMRHTDTFRGPGFEPISFKIEKITTPKLVDAKGRLMPTVRAVTITEQEQAEESRRTRDDEDQLLVALLINPNRSHADLARACKFFFENGEPAKSRLQRTLRRLQQSSPQLIRQNPKYWALSEEGRKAAEKLRDDPDETIEDRGGANSGKAFTPRVGKPCGPTVPCAHCGFSGNVFKIGDGRLPKGKAHAEALHHSCAEDFF